MNNLLSRHSEPRKLAAILAGVLLLTALMASIAAGPDESKASNVNSDWEIFEGHAYAENRAAPAGVSLVACLGGCEDGFQTEPVITGRDGIYQVKVEPGQSRPAGRMVTFWLLNDTDRIEADQDVLFRGQGETRVLDLNFVDLPIAMASKTSEPATGSTGAADSTDSAATNTAAESSTGSGSTSGEGSASGSTSGAGSGSGSVSTNGAVTTDLTVPSASDLGLVPSDSPQAYASVVSIGGMPLLPGFVIVLGLLMTMIGVSLLIYRRRLTW